MEDVKNKVINKEHLKKAMSYEMYKSLMQQLTDEGRTTGENQSEAMVGYTKMNWQRMKRIEKTLSINEETANIAESKSKDWVWVILTEPWCGDAAQNIPLIQSIAEKSGKIEVYYLLRDENLEIMDAYLTNGGRSIPKLVCLKKDSLVEVGTWGPRPAKAQELVLDFKENGDGDYKKFVVKVQKWYNEDRGEALQSEINALISEWSEA